VAYRVSTVSTVSTYLLPKKKQEENIHEQRRLVDSKPALHSANIHALVALPNLKLDHDGKCI
jgi:hypothetical protein